MGLSDWIKRMSRGDATLLKRRPASNKKRNTAPRVSPVTPPKPKARAKGKKAWRAQAVRRWHLERAAEVGRKPVERDRFTAIVRVLDRALLTLPEINRAYVAGGQAGRVTIADLRRLEKSFTIRRKGAFYELSDPADFF